MKLVLISDADRKPYSFDQFPIIIGNQPGAHVALPPSHNTQLTIIQQDGTFFVCNEAADPFASLNGLPFHKRKIANGDLIEIAPNIKINIEIEDIVKAPPKEETPPAPPVRKRDPKPITIKDIEEEFEPAEKHPSKAVHHEKKSMGRNIKMLFALLGIFVLLLSFSASAFYTKAVVTTEKDEIRAAEGVADIAMALMYAQVNNIKPKKQNWSDPEFIKNNLAAVLTHDYPALSNIDTHGQFSNCPYILRIYTNGDLSRFVVIAQPTPSLLQWLIPKQTIVVDSYSMELKKIEDVRTLNRILVAPNALEAANSTELAKLISQAPVVSMSQLDAHRKGAGFSPPKALALIYPTAKERIYNAPRYYQFGESIVKRALTLGSQTIGSQGSLLQGDSNHERSRLKQEMEALSRLPQMVLYSTQGIEMAMQTQKALAYVLPEAKFISGYLKFNSKGDLISSNLIIDQDRALLQDKSGQTQSSEWLNVQKILENAAKKLHEMKAQASLKENPIESALKQLKLNYELALRPYSEGIITALQGDLAQLDLKEIQKLFTDYLLASQEERAKLQDEMAYLYDESSEISFEEFLNSAKKAGLEEIIPHDLY